MLNAEDIIEQLGGAKRIADELGIPLTTVASWKPVNFIPRWWQRDLLTVAQKQDKALSLSDFPTPAMRLPRPKRAA